MLTRLGRQRLVSLRPSTRAAAPESSCRHAAAIVIPAPATRFPPKKNERMMLGRFLGGKLVPVPASRLFQSGVSCPRCARLRLRPPAELPVRFKPKTEAET